MIFTMIYHSEENSAGSFYVENKGTIKGDVKFGARKDTRDVETSSKSSGENLSVRIKMVQI